MGVIAFGREKVVIADICNKKIILVSASQWEIVFWEIAKFLGQNKT